MKLDLNWQKFKWCAVTLIVFGQRTRAVSMFEDMLKEYPEDSYALGRRHGRVAAGGAGSRAGTG